MKRAIFPGSFDPFTVGHESIVRRALPLFDEIIIAVGINTNKPGYFSVEQRLDWINEVFKHEDKIRCDSYNELTVEYCKRVDAKYILRGIRTSADFEYERAIAQVNKKMYPDIESIFILTTPEHTPINSSIVRDIIRHGGDASEFLPNGVSIEPGQFRV